MDTDYQMPVELMEVDKRDLLMIYNPNYDALIGKYPCLRPVKLRGPAGSPGAISRRSGCITTKVQPLLRREGEPVAENRNLGWFIMSLGIEVEAPALMFAPTGQTYYDELCCRDILGLADRLEGDQTDVYHKFKQQLEREPSGCYITGLPWRDDHPHLATKEAGSKQHLQNLIRQLEASSLVDTQNGVLPPTESSCLENRKRDKAAYCLQW